MEKSNNTIACIRQDLLKEWDYNKNKDICTSETTTIGSNKKVWWICNKGHSFEQAVYKRTSRKASCPICSGKKVLAGYNDLRTQNPELANDWDYQKNTEYGPDEVTLHSNKEAWWKCSVCGYEWKAIINDRANGRGCPICSKNLRIIKFRENNMKRGKNDLATLHPELIQEWNYEKNFELLQQDFTCGSQEKVWWRCSVCGNEWQAIISNRVNRHSGCPKCMKYKRTSFPEQALLYYILKIYPKAENSYTAIFAPEKKELDIFIPEIKYGIEYDGVAWHSDNRAKRVDQEKYLICKNNGIKLIRVSEKPVETENCDFFVLRGGQDEESLDKAIRETISIISEKELDINTVIDRNAIMKQYITVIKNKSIEANYPESIIEWDFEKNDGITPDMVNATTNKKYWWRCSLGHSYQSAPSYKLAGNHGCPICSGKNLLSGFNDLKTKYPDIAKEWDYIKNHPKEPSGIKVGSMEKFWWICDKGHSFQATPNNRTANGTGCPYCVGKAVLEGFNDLGTTNPELLSIWDYEKNQILPQSVSYGSSRIVWWRCKNNHNWRNSISKQALYNSCPVCSYRELQYGINDLASTNPEIAEEWDNEKNNLTPAQVTKIYDKYVWWICKDCGFSWKQTVRIRTEKGSGCPKCGYSKKMQKTRGDNLNQKEKDLKSLFPEIIAEWDYDRNGELDPSRMAPSSNHKVWWLCKQGHHYSAWISDRTGKRKKGCPICAGKKRLDTIIESKPELYTEWDFEKNFPLRPEDVYIGSRKKVFWICPKGHSFEAAVCERAKENGTNCPYCSNHKVLLGYNDLQTKRPDIAAEWHPTKNGTLSPSMVVEKSGKNVWWKCKKCGYEWERKVVARTSNANASCPNCARKKRNKAVKCVETLQVFNSIRDAARWAGVTDSSIICCLKGRNNTSAGYHWVYFDL